MTLRLGRAFVPAVTSVLLSAHAAPATALLVDGVLTSGVTTTRAAGTEVDFYEFTAAGGEIRFALMTASIQTLFVVFKDDGSLDLPFDFVAKQDGHWSDVPPYMYLVRDFAPGNYLFVVAGFAARMEDLLDGIQDGTPTSFASAVSYADYPYRVEVTGAFTDIRPRGQVPLPSSLALVGLGLVGLLGTIGLHWHVRRMSLLVS